MNTIQDLFQQAQLAEAAYADFFDNSGNLLTNTDDVKAALTRRKGVTRGEKVSGLEISVFGLRNK